MPEWSVPDGFNYLVEWFDELNEGVNRYDPDGALRRITWTELRDWSVVTNKVVQPHEFAILRAMDLGYIDGLSGEFEFARRIAAERARREQEGRT